MHNSGIAGQASAGEVGSANPNKELAMPVVLIHQGPTVTAENYRATVQKLAGKDDSDSLSDWPVGERLGPILEEVGITDPRETYAAQTFVSS
jgi:hypothetical protein